MSLPEVYRIASSTERRRKDWTSTASSNTRTRSDKLKLRRCFHTSPKRSQDLWYPLSEDAVDAKSLYISLRGNWTCALNLNISKVAKQTKCLRLRKSLATNCFWLRASLLCACPVLTHPWTVTSSHRGKTPISISQKPVVWLHRCTFKTVILIYEGFTARWWGEKIPKPIIQSK